MRQDAWRAYLEMALGVTEASGKKALKTAKKLVGRSGVSAEQLQGMADELVRTSAANREAVRNLVRVELERALGAFGLAKADEVETLTARVRELEATLQARKPAAESVADSGPVPSSLTTPTAKKAVAKKTTAKKTVAKKAAPAQPAAEATAAPAAEATAAPATEATAAPAAKTTAKKATKKAATKAATKATPSAIGAEITAPAPGPAGPEPRGAAPARKAVKKAVKKTPGSAAPAQ